MRSRTALAPRSAAPEDKDAIAPDVSAQSTIRQEAPANDDESTSGFSFFGDPLFGMAIASVILFAVLAALVALS
jgi:hypothetical protein